MRRDAIIRQLRKTILDQVDSQIPDLADMGRQVGRLVASHQPELQAALAPLRKSRGGFERWLIGEQAMPATSILLIRWPPAYAAPVHDHGGLWGLEVVLVGALAVESYRRDVDSFVPTAREWLVPGDATWFDEPEDHAHRCRDLSRHEAAVTLHVYGGSLRDYRAYERFSRGLWEAVRMRATVSGMLEALEALPDSALR